MRFEEAVVAMLRGERVKRPGSSQTFIYDRGMFQSALPGACGVLIAAWLEKMVNDKDWELVEAPAESTPEPGDLREVQVLALANEEWVAELERGLMAVRERLDRVEAEIKAPATASAVEAVKSDPAALERARAALQEADRLWSVWQTMRGPAGVRCYAEALRECAQAFSWLLPQKPVAGVDPGAAEGDSGSLSAARSAQLYNDGVLTSQKGEGREPFSTAIPEELLNRPGRTADEVRAHLDERGLS